MESLQLDIKYLVYFLSSVTNTIESLVNFQELGIELIPSAKLIRTSDISIALAIKSSHIITNENWLYFMIKK